MAEASGALPEVLRTTTTTTRHELVIGLCIYRDTCRVALSHRSNNCETPTSIPSSCLHGVPMYHTPKERAKKNGHPHCASARCIRNAYYRVFDWWCLAPTCGYCRDVLCRYDGQ